ncbi:unnamed protein product [Lupinus luteus]|uniref:AP2/ERF domain-containing protein n=1 Tax=Lupinus luteus TaxID=3873 RepID=A0AAV1X8B2_LUPLU
MVKRENNKIHTTQSSKSMQSLSSPSSAVSSNDKKKKYKGVRMRSWGSWVSEIRAPNQKTRIWLGSYSTAEAAARAYDAALLCLKGSSANLNFPLTSSHYIPQENTAMSPKSIQRVAAAAANTFMNNANSNSIASPSHLIASTSSSLVSSPISMSSSPSNHIDDDFSLLSSFKAYTSCDQTHESMAMMDSWYGFDGYHVDQMLSETLFDIGSTQLLDDLYEESDIRLWNFR